MLILTSCNTDDLNSCGIGTAESYPSFLFVKADTGCISKKFDFEFSDDAIGDNCYISFYIADADNKYIDLQKEKIELYINEKKVDDKITLKADENNNPQEIEVKIRPLHGARKGNQRFELTTS